MKKHVKTGEFPSHDGGPETAEIGETVDISEQAKKSEIKAGFDLTRSYNYTYSNRGGEQWVSG